MLNRLAIAVTAVGVLLFGPRGLASQDSSADVPNCPATRDPAERLWCQGGAKWESRDYNGAIQYLTKALDLYKKHPTLSKTTWRILVDNLGMAHGMAGNLGKAKEIFRIRSLGRILPTPCSTTSWLTTTPRPATKASASIT